MTKETIDFIFFGGEPLGMPTLEELKTEGLLPRLIVCNPDRPAGRGQQLQVPPVKQWAEAHGIPVWQPTDLKNKDIVVQAIGLVPTVFVVVAYNKILPEWLVQLPKHGTVNVHPSLLPKLRGASPIRSAILRNEPEHIGVTIMQMDAKMDHGPILKQQAMPIANEHWPVSGPELDEALARQGAALLADTLPRYVAGEIAPTEQAHDAATYCGRLDKSMAELVIDPLNLPTNEAAEQALLVIEAFKGIGNAWFIYEDTRYKVISAHITNQQLVIDTIIPAGKKETFFTHVFKT